MPNTLERLDLLDLEQRLCDTLFKVVPFESHAIFFPQEPPSGGPEWLPDESRLLVPLRYGDAYLGTFMARHPDVDRVTGLLPSLPDITALCLENLELYKTGRQDSLTGLATREVLLERLAREIEAIRSAFGQGVEADEETKPQSGCLALLVVRFDGLSDITRETSYRFSEQLTTQLAQALVEGLSAEKIQGLAARTGDYELTIFLPDGTRPQCESLAAEIVRRMELVRLNDLLTGRRFGVRPHTGYALYPQDMDGVRQRDEQARILLHKAGLASEVARTRARYANTRENRVMGFCRILPEGGSIRQIFPLSRVLASLGRSVGAREGQRFSVWSVRYEIQGEAAGESLQPLYKGEIVLLEVRENEAVAEILNLGDPAWPLEINDQLTLMPEERGLAIQESGFDGLTHRPDPLTGLYRHGDFLARLAESCSQCEKFALALVHLDLNARPDAAFAENPVAAHPPHLGNQESPPDHVMALAVDCCRAAFASLPGASETSVLGGRFGLNSLIFFHPELDAESLLPLYERICKEIFERLGFRVGTGLGCWPFLQFRPAEMLECTRKALEYALLLPSPHVGKFDSLALNISADKRHCRGDTFGAIEEYKLALLADGNNALAWNSLGVCLASLGHHAEARRYFEEALNRTPDDPALAYNLGAVCQSLHDVEAAETYFRSCIELAPTHLYATIRLGQLAEGKGNLDEARILFESVACHPGSALPHRHLARLAQRQNKSDEARVHLHQALLCNPRDAVALSLMASLYLDGGEDPELAETLAHQSIAQRPDRKNGWLVLARALEAQGRRADAREALLRAGEV